MKQTGKWTEVDVPVDLVATGVKRMYVSKLFHLVYVQDAGRFLWEIRTPRGTPLRSQYELFGFESGCPLTWANSQAKALQQLGLSNA